MQGAGYRKTFFSITKVNIFAVLSLRNIFSSFWVRWFQRLAIVFTYSVKHLLYTIPLLYDVKNKSALWGIIIIYRRVKKVIFLLISPPSKFISLIIKRKTVLCKITAKSQKVIWWLSVLYLRSTEIYCMTKIVSFP